jgi:Dienelactone hydrolase family
MNRLANISAFSLVLLACANGSSPAQVQEAVDRYRSGEAMATVECFAPAASGKFPAILLLHAAGGLDATADVFREMAHNLASQGYVVLFPHYFERTGHIPGQPAGLKSKEIPYETHIYRRMGHNFDMAAWADASRRSALFFSRYVKGIEPRKRASAKAASSPASKDEKPVHAMGASISESGMPSPKSGTPYWGAIFSRPTVEKPRAVRLRERPNAVENTQP